MPGRDHEWLRCVDPSCRLRLPVPAAQVGVVACPVCGADLVPGPEGSPRLGGSVGAGTVPPRAGARSRVVGPPGARPPGGGSSGEGSPAGRSPVGGSQAGPPIVAAGLLDNVRSVRNVGAALRTADAAGLAHVHLVGITAPGDHPRITKTALGAEDAVAWSHTRDGPGLVAALQADGWQVWALEEGAAAEPLAIAAAGLHAAGASQPGRPAAPPPARIVVVVGHEVAGVDPAILAAADRHVAIPMRGTKRSLNVSVAFGIAVYALTTPGPQSA